MRRSWRVMSACALLLAAASVLFSAYLYTRSDDATKDNCARIHGVVQTLDGFLAGSRPRLIQLEREGTLTHKQVQRGLSDNRKQRTKLRSVDCPTPPPRP